jgi:hypothetical protein
LGSGNRIDELPQHPANTSNIKSYGELSVSSEAMTADPMPPTADAPEPPPRPQTLNAEVIAAAREAAAAADLPFEVWLNNAIMQQVARNGPAQAAELAAEPSLARQLENARAAAQREEVSLTDWLNRAILSHCSKPASLPADVPAAGVKVTGRRSGSRWGAYGSRISEVTGVAVVLFIAIGIWALPQVAPPKQVTSAAVDGAPPAREAEARRSDTGVPPALEDSGIARPSQRAEAAPGLPIGEDKAPLPESADGEVSKTALRDMPRPPSAHLDWYRRAAEAGNAEAQYTLAELHLKGEGVTKDFAAAVDLFRRSGERGLARSQYALGLLYARGLGVEKSDVDAVLWWQRAADQGHLAAVAQVGLALLRGQGVERNLDAARKMLLRAAEGDEVNAQFALARLYEQGESVAKDPVLAMKWFILAAEQAHPLATQKVEELTTTLPREHQERATEMVSEHYRRFRRRG